MDHDANNVSSEEPENAVDTSASLSPDRQRRPLHVQILIGLLIGAVVGTACNVGFRLPDDPGQRSALDTNGDGVDDRLEGFANNIAEPLGRVFLRLVLMVVLPLVFSALVLGVMGFGDMSRLGRVGLTSLVFMIVLSGISVVIGLTMVNLIRPGGGVTDQQRATLEAGYDATTQQAIDRAKQAKPFQRIILDMITENPFQEAVGALDGSSKGNGMLSIMFFALLFGIALSMVPEDRARGLVHTMEGLFETTMIIIGMAMRLAPLCVGCLMFSLTAKLGGDILVSLVWFVVTVVGGLALQMFVVYSLAVWFFAKRNPVQFFRDSSEAILMAFGTSSSNATLPTALRVAQEDLDIPPAISRFVLTVGATANQNGTAMYEGVVVLFLAQVFGVELSLVQQITVVLMSILAGVGTAGVPGGSIPLIIILLQTVGVPPDGIAIILGIDRLLDMCRTTLNVTGDLALAACVARWEARAQRTATATS